MSDPIDPREAWPAAEPPPDFAERVLAAARAGDGAGAGRTATASRVRSVRRVGAIAAALVAAAAGVALWAPPRAPAHGEAIAADRTQVSIGARAAAVLERGAHVSWSGDDVTQSAGDVFYRVQPGAPFRVHTPAGDVTALGTCFRVSVDADVADSSPSRSIAMNTRDVKSAAVGAAIAGFAMVAVYEGKVAVSHAGQSTTTLGPGESARTGGDGILRGGGGGETADVGAGRPAGGEGTDSAYEEANRNLAGTVKEYQSRLTAIEDERKTLQGRLASAEAKLAAAASDGGAVKNEWEITPADWAEMAKNGMVKFRLPCASSAAWDPTPEKLNKLGLSPGDMPSVKAAYAKSNQRVWSQVKPLCAEALGGTLDVAEKLGRATCTQLIIDVARRTEGDAYDETTHVVAEMRAGLRPMPSPGDKVSPLVRLYLILTGENHAFEQDLAQSFGPEEAHHLSIADEMCTESSTIDSGPRHAPGR